MLVFVFALFALWFRAPKTEVTREEIPAGWKVATSSTVTFFYPEDISTTYIHPVDWPPAVQLVAAPFTCTEAGVETARAGQSSKELINGREYCVTRTSEGAAGSTYTQYAYATEIQNQVAIFTFTFRSVQCANYDDPQRTECETERSAFDVNALLDRIVRTATF